MKNNQPAIKWSGGKRNSAIAIFNHRPPFNRYYEPFVGGGAVAYVTAPTEGVCGDICKPLIQLYDNIQNNHEKVYEEYKTRWDRLQNEGHTAFGKIRNNFNRNQNPDDLLFLSRTCINGLIRFNKKGEFNSSLHLTRKGINPSRLKAILSDWSKRLQGINFRYGDYQDTSYDIKANDFAYLDPPYFHTKGRYYYGTIDYERFLNYLDLLNQKNVKYALSFDGKRVDRDYSVNIPKELYKRHLWLPTGNSSFKKVMEKKNEPVFESLYLNY